MRYIFVWILFGLMPVSAANRALLVAVEKNLYFPENPLFGLDIDLEKMIGVSKMMGFEDGEIKILRGTAPTASAIEANIQSWLIDQVEEGDKALFYYTGHGSYILDRNGEEDDKHDEILCPSDLKRGPYGFANAFTDDQFGNLISKLRTDRFLILIDACHSGTITRGAPSNQRMKRLVLNNDPKGRGGPEYKERKPKADPFVPTSASPDNYVSISACQDYQSAIATSKGSLFTLGVYFAVRQAHQHNQKITPNEIAAFSARFISQHIRDKAKIHHPKLGGDAYRFNQPVLESRVSRPPAGSPQRPTPGEPAQPAASPNWKYLLEIAQKSTFTLDIRANQNEHRLGEVLKIEVQAIPDDGYLYVFAVDPNDAVTMLFPNKYQTGNRIQLKRDTRSYAVEALASVMIPSEESPFVLRAVEPFGETLVVVLHMASPLDFGEKGAETTGDGLFRLLGKAELETVETKMRGYAVEAKPTTNYAEFGAGVLILKTIP